MVAMIRLGDVLHVPAIGVVSELEVSPAQPAANASNAETM
jgi:hypothetical protein